jgi:hypothetical protein
MEGDAAHSLVMDCEGRCKSDAIAWWIGADLPITPHDEPDDKAVARKAIVRGRPFLSGSAHARNCGRLSQCVARLAQPRNARGQYQRSIRRTR